MSEKPLHVRVAEALGVIRRPALPLGPSTEWARRHDWWVSADAEGFIPRYDTDWSATGPLIERFGITLEYMAYAAAKALPCEEMPYWQASWHGEYYLASDTPLRAVCKLILTLAEADKLPRVETQEQKR